MSLKNGVFCVENTDARIEEEDLKNILCLLYRVEAVPQPEQRRQRAGALYTKTILDHHGISYKMENTEKGVRLRRLSETSETGMAGSDREQNPSVRFPVFLCLKNFFKKVNHMKVTANISCLYKGIKFRQLHRKYFRTSSRLHFPLYNRPIKYRRLQTMNLLKRAGLYTLRSRGRTLLLFAVLLLALHLC